MLENVQYMINTKTAVVQVGDETRIYERENEAYQKVRRLILEEDAEGLRQLVLGLKDQIERVYDGFRVENDVIFVGEEALPPYLGRRLKDMADANKPYTYVLNFWERVKQNPSWYAVQYLFECLDRNLHPFAPDGRYLAWKAVRSDFTDKRTGKFLNAPGHTVQVDRRSVDDRHEVECSYGLHVGSFEYANGFANQEGDKIVKVLVDPADVVTVPPGNSYQKLRVCRYEVIEEIPRNSPAPTEQTAYEEDEDEDFEGDFDMDDEDEDEWEDPDDDIEDDDDSY